MFKPMLATDIEINKLRLPVYVSTKLEGVRVEFTPSGMKPRSLKTFGNQLHLKKRFIELEQYAKSNGIFLEGEIYRHGWTFNRISSACRGYGNKDVEQLEVHLFDAYLPGRNLVFSQRILHIQAFVQKMRLDHKYHYMEANQELYLNHDEIQIRYESDLQAGFEGLCFKDPNGTYKGGTGGPNRSTKNEQKFLRIKDQKTWDGKVINIIERMENLVPSHTNELGYLAKTQDKDLKMPTGLAAVAVVQCEDFDEPIRVTLSKGLTDFDREEIWEWKETYIGKHLEFLGIPVKGMKPRSPRFLRWRNDLD